jgi:hypothetical protein
MTAFARLYSRFEEVLRPYGKPIDIWPVRPGSFVEISDGRQRIRKLLDFSIDSSYFVRRQGG